MGFDPSSYLDELFKKPGARPVTPAPGSTYTQPAPRLPLPKTAAELAQDNADRLAALEDDDDDGLDTLGPAPYRPQVYGPGFKRPMQDSLIERLGATTKRVGSGALEFGKQFLRDLDVTEEGISPQERVFRAANVGAFFLPPVKIAQTAGLATRIGVRALEAGAVTGGLSSLREGDQAVMPNALLGAGIGGTIEAVLSRGRVRNAAAISRELAPEFRDPVRFTNPTTTALHSKPWAIVSAQLTDSSHIRLTAEQNMLRHSALKAEVERLGYEPIEARGLGPHQELDQFENVLLVPGMSKQHAMELNTRFGQRSMLTSDGLYNFEDGTLSPFKRSGTQFNDAIPKDVYHTQLEDGTRFSVDFDQPIEISTRALKPITTSEQAVDSLIGRAKPSTMDKLLNYPLKTTLKSWYIKTVRSFAGIEDMESFLGTPTQQRAVKDSAAKLAQLAGGWSTYAQHMWEYGIPKWKDRTVTVAPGLSELFERVKPGEWAAFTRYGMARRFLHLTRDRGYELPMLPNGEQLTLDQVYDVVENTERELPHLKQIVDDVQAWRNKAMYEMLVEPGILSQRAYDAIISTSEEFVPLRRAFEDAAQDIRTQIPLDDMAVLTNPVERLKKLGGEFMPWQEALVRDIYSWSKLAHNQDYALAMIRELERNDASAAKLFAQRVNLPTPELSDLQKTVIAELGASDPELARAAEQTGTELLGMLAPTRLHGKGYIGGLLPVEGFERLLEDGTPEFLTQAEMDRAMWSGQISAENFVEQGWRKTNDVRRVWYKVTNPDIWEAFSVMNAGQINLATRLMGSIATILRSGATLAFEFMARNPLKDVAHAGVTTDAAARSVVEGFAHVMKRDEVYQRYLASGGGRASLVGMDRAAISQHIEEAVGVVTHSQGAIGKLYNVVRTPVEALQALSDFLESGTRVGVFDQKYRELVQNGIKPADAVRTAALASRNATVDFGVHGSRTQSLRLITAFWNAQIQGYDNLLRSFKVDPAGATARALTYITLPSVALYMVNRDDPEYFELPTWEREMFWHIKIPDSVPWAGDKWLRFPKPFDLGVIFGSSVERFLEFLDTGDKQAVDALAGAYISKNIGDLMPIPTAARPLIENAINKSFMRDRPIESRALADVAPGYRIQPGTTELAAHLGRWLNYSPVKIDNIMSGYGAGLGRLGNDIVDAAIHIGEGRPVLPDGMFDPRDIPGLRGIFSQFPRHAEPVDKLYEAGDMLREAEYTRAHLQKTLALDDLSDWMQQKAVILGASQSMDAMLDQMKQLREMRDMILRDKTLSSTERARQLDSIGRMMLAISRASQPVVDMVKNEK